MVQNEFEFAWFHRKNLSDIAARNHTLEQGARWYYMKKHIIKTRKRYWNLHKFASYQETKSKSSFKSKLFKTNWNKLNDLPQIQNYKI